MKLAFFFRRYHKWLALIVGIQAVLWCLSGLYMTALHIDWVHGDHLVKTVKPKPITSTHIQPLLLDSLTDFKQLKSISLLSNGDSAEYKITTIDASYRLNASNLKKLEPLNQNQIRQKANDIYAGDGQILSVELLDSYPRELGGKAKPIWRVSYDDWLNSTLYFIPEDGSLRSKRSDLWRWFDFLWMLHIMDYDSRENVNNNLLRVAASIGLLLTLSGLGLLIAGRKKKYQTQNSNTASKNAVQIVKIWHKRIAMLVGLQLFLWMLSGLVFSLLAQTEVSGRSLLKKQSAPSFITSRDPAKNSKLKQLSADFTALLKLNPNILSISSYAFEGALLGDKPLYLLKTSKDTWLVESQSLKKVSIDKSKARLLALASYQGEGRITSIKPIEQKTIETRKLPLPLWQVNFNDNGNTSVYLSASTGEVFAAKSDLWRIFDFFWMLHIMDYSERSDINNALVIFAVSIASFIALTGLWLVFSAFSLQDFNLILRFKKLPLVLRYPDGNHHQIFSSIQKTLYSSLAEQNIHLPSQCGGAGTCGLCRVKVLQNTPQKAADKSLLSSQERKAGFRLACQLKVSQALEIELLETNQQQSYKCRLQKSRLVTPLIKELTLELPEDESFDFRAGQYLQVEIPQGSSSLTHIQVDSVYQAFWKRHNIAKHQSSRKQNIKRAYSMANSPSDNKQIKLNVRLELDLTNKNKTDCGQGSGYLFAAELGDVINVSGPFGQFYGIEKDSKTEQAAEMVFIGGGAGMAPLKSHIFHQLSDLASNRKISFWFGARNPLEIFYQNEFDALVNQHANFSWQVALSDQLQDSSWKGLTGTIDKVVESEFINQHALPQNCEYYVCGPSAMNKAVVAMLKRNAVSESQIRVDEFGDPTLNLNKLL